MALKNDGILPSLSRCFDFYRSSCKLFWEKAPPTMLKILAIVSIDLMFSS